MKTSNIEKAVELLKASTEQVNIVRVLDGGEYISVHSQHVDGEEKKAAIDIYRFENGEAVGHLSNSQTMPEAPNPAYPPCSLISSAWKTEKLQSIGMLLHRKHEFHYGMVISQ